MNDTSNQQEAVELLQQLGLKAYEAKCFVALARLPQGTAKEISETSDVPRTRVYEAVRVLETKGLVEIQHSSPQQFRAVPISEAAATLREEYASRTDTLVEVIEAIEPARRQEDHEVTHEVWAMSGSSAIDSRTTELVDEAEHEAVIVVGRENVLTDPLLEQLAAASESGVDVLVGTPTEPARDRAQTALADAHVFVSELEWLQSSPVDPADDTLISRLLLVDGATILVGTVQEAPTEAREVEKAVFGRGFDNGIVAIARRLMATGLRTTRDPDVAED